MTDLFTNLAARAGLVLTPDTPDTTGAVIGAEAALGTGLAGGMPALQPVLQTHMSRASGGFIDADAAVLGPPAADVYPEGATGQVPTAQTHAAASIVPYDQAAVIPQGAGELRGFDAGHRQPDRARTLSDQDHLFALRPLPVTPSDPAGQGNRSGRSTGANGTHGRANPGHLVGARNNQTPQTAAVAPSSRGAALGAEGVVADHGGADLQTQPAANMAPRRSSASSAGSVRTLEPFMAQPEAQPSVSNQSQQRSAGPRKPHATVGAVTLNIGKITVTAPQVASAAPVAAMAPEPQYRSPHAQPGASSGRALTQFLGWRRPR